MNCPGRVVSIALALLFAACGPSIDAAAKADIDRRIAELRAPSEVHGTPAVPQPLPLVAGQWATYKFVDSDKKPSFMTMKLIAQEGSAFWYETLSESYQGKSATRMLVDFGDRMRPESVTIKAAKIRDAKGNVTEYPEAMIGMVNSILRGNLGPILVNWTGLPQEDTAVPAGRFVGSYKGRAEVSFAGFKSTSVTWSHPVVPLGGMVRSEGEDGATGELVAFGSTGATSSF